MSIVIRNQADFDRLVTLGSTPESVTLEFKQDYGERHIPKSDPES